MSNKKTNYSFFLRLAIFIYLLASSCFITINQALAQAKMATPINVPLQVPIFGYTTATDLAGYIKNLYKYGLYALVPLAIIIIIYAGIKWILAGGNLAQIKEAKTYITSALTGLTIGLLSYVILSFVGITQLKTPGFEYIEPEEVDFDISAGLQSGNPAAIASTNASYAAVCAKYGGSFKESVALECKALGENPPAGLNIVSMGSYGRDAGQRAEAGAFDRFKKSADCVKSKFGVTVTASGWRSAAGQYAAWYRVAAGYAAKPCCSNHGKGVAFDVRINGSKVSDFGPSDKYLKDCCNANGLYAKMRSSPTEPWHFSPSGY